jgi:uncharacterized membrane protein
MGKNRLEAFSDGVIAILITIMVLDLKVPRGDSLQALIPMGPVFLSYVLSFIYLAIYWNNHHHLLHAVQHVSGGILWANMQLLFWLSLVPFSTAWMGENAFAPVPTAAYGFSLLMPGIAWRILQSAIVRVHGPDSLIAHALGRDRKGKLSLVLYAAAIPLAFVQRWAAGGLFALVALIWLVPDRRIERALNATHEVQR